MRIVVFLIACFLSSGSGIYQNPCGNTLSYSTYAHAIAQVRTATYSYSERINTDQSTWIQLAEYFSCDGQTGFLIITTDQKEYIHKDVPIGIWEAFKASDSKGGFYNQAIKGEFGLELSAP